jgi:type I restriction enzyme S subunit
MIDMLEDLPLGWTHTTINEVTAKTSQRRPEPEEEFLYIDISSIDRDTKRIEEPKLLVGENAPSRARRIVLASDVLVSMTRPNLNAVALVPQELDGQIASTGLEVLRAVLIEPRWLFYLVQTDEFVSTMASIAQGAVYPAVRSRDIQDYEIPLAPLTEQQRISDKLDELFARLDTCQARLDHVQIILDRFRQSVVAAATSGMLTEDWRAENNRENLTDLISFSFVDADCFGEYRFPSTWKTLRLGEVAEITTGITKSSKNQDPSYEEVPYLRVANVQRGYFDLEDVKSIRAPKARIEKLLLEPGDLLFNEGGDIDKLGRGWVWSGEIERCIFQNHVFRGRLSDPDFNPKFFSHYGNSRGFDYFLTYGKQTTNLASISKSVLSALPIVVPPADEQDEIVQRVEELFALADRVEVDHQTAQTHVEHLTPAILSKAFRGELVPQDPNDELASALLEKIRAERATMSDKPKKVSSRKKLKRIKMNKETVKEIIHQLPNNKFSFGELRDKLPGNYDELKEIVFALLSEPEPSITQVFDETSQAMRFIRGNK